MIDVPGTKGSAKLSQENRGNKFFSPTGFMVDGYLAGRGYLIFID
jgi:hypothetical protein